MARRIRPIVEQNVATMDENDTVSEAATLMTEKYIGSVVVTSSSKIKGIFTERDIMMKVVGQKKDPEIMKIKDVMSLDIVKADPDDTCSYCLKKMKKKRCRHLMVFNGDKFFGIVSLRDLVALMMDEKEELISDLEKYITGR